MSKHENPPFRMIIDHGKLVPATAYDQERLDTYRNNTTVRVRFTEDRDRVMVRKWWAVLNRAVKECKTPWKNKEEASEAIKLALGIVNLAKTVGGDFMAYPKSLTELTDPELDDAVLQMIDVIYNVTGVDPQEWKKQIADIVDDEPDQETALAKPPTGDVAAGSGDPSITPPDPAADSLTPEEREWLKTAAKMLVAASMPGWDPDVVRAQYAGILKTLTPAGISQAAIAKAGAIGKQCVSVCHGTEELDLALIAGLAGCDVGDIRP